MTVNVLKALLEEKRLRSIHDVLSMYNPVDLAELLSELDDRELAMVSAYSISQKLRRLSATWTTICVRSLSKLFPAQR